MDLDGDGMPPCLVSHRDVGGLDLRASNAWLISKPLPRVGREAPARERPAPQPGRSGLTKRALPLFSPLLSSHSSFPGRTYSRQHLVARDPGGSCLLGCQARACVDLDSAKPAVAPEGLAAPAGPWTGGPSRQRERVFFHV